MKAQIIRAYKWAEDIPDKWDIKPLWTLGTVKSIRCSELDMLSVYLDRGVIPARDGELGTHAASLDLSNYQLVEPGDFVLNNQQAWRGSVGVSFLKGMISPAYIIFQLGSELDWRYANYLLRTNFMADQYMLASRGVGSIQRQVHMLSLRSVSVLVPPIETQRRIANFLDTKTKIIDEVVAKKTRLAELLKEKRAAIITRSITKGLDPQAKLKPSGITWLGDIPEGWGVKKLKFVASVRASSVDKKSYEGEKRVLLCNYVDVYKNESITSALLFMHATATDEQSKKLGLRVGDVIITKDSETSDDIGIPALVKEDIPDLVCGYHLYLLRSNGGEVLGEYLFRFMQTHSVKGYFEIHSNGITRFGLGSYEVASTFIPIPPIGTQKQISEFLDLETQKIDKTTELISTQIEKLKEYRTSLIYSAVTGKIQV